MTQIEVPDWVVEVAAKAMADSIGHGMAEKCEKHALAALAAALGAWVVPVGYENRWHCTGNKWVSRDPAHPDDGDSQPIYTLRQEKPE